MSIDGRAPETLYDEAYLLGVQWTQIYSYDAFRVFLLQQRIRKPKLPPLSPWN